MRVAISVIPSSQFETQLREGVLVSMRKKLQTCMSIWAEQIQIDVGQFLKHVFDQTEVAKGLRGSGTIDLAAHFGLSSEAAVAMADGMGALIEHSVRVGTLKGTDIRIGIRAIKDDWDMFMRLPNAAYISGGGFTIPVMQWLLVDPYVDWDDAVYGIIFNGGGSASQARSFIQSRSGKAIMIRAGGNVSPWVVPYICVGPNGTNFIEYTLGQPGVARQCAEFVFDVLKGWNG